MKTTTENIMARAYEEFNPDCEVEYPNTLTDREILDSFVTTGDWGEGGGSVRVCIQRPGDDEYGGQWHTVDIPEDHEALILKALDEAGLDWDDVCGRDPDDHDWTSEGEGGCDSNPGVWSHGGTAMSYASHCTKCRLHRHEHDPGAQRNPGEAFATNYTIV